MKEYILFSDPHGEYKALVDSLEAAGYHPKNKNQWLVSVGDLFDRGSQSLEIFQFLDKIERKLMILGNHDEFLLDFLEEDFRDFEWHCLHNGLWETLKSFAGLPKDEPYAIWVPRKWELRNIILTKNPTLLDFLKSMVPVIMIDKNIITHGGFKKDYLSEKWVVNNFCNTEDFVAKTENLNIPFTFIFGHWFAAHLHLKFNKKVDYSKKFKYKNYIGLDGATNVFHTVFIHKIFSNSEPYEFIGQVSLNFLVEYYNLENF